MTRLYYELRAPVDIAFPRRDDWTAILPTSYTVRRYYAAQYLVVRDSRRVPAAIDYGGLIIVYDDRLLSLAYRVLRHRGATDENIILAAPSLDSPPVFATGDVP